MYTVHKNLTQHSYNRTESQSSRSQFSKQKDSSVLTDWWGSQVLNWCGIFNTLMVAGLKDFFFLITQDPHVGESCSVVVSDGFLDRAESLVKSGLKVSQVQHSPPVTHNYTSAGGFSTTVSLTLTTNIGPGLDINCCAHQPLWRVFSKGTVHSMFSLDTVLLLGFCFVTKVNYNVLKFTWTRF